MDIGLISCTKSKQDTATQPRSLYEPSALFHKARAYCETYHDNWYILSAKYHLLDPDGPPIPPYDKTLTDTSISEHCAWAEQVGNELQDTGLLAPDTTLVIHAGRAYYEELLPVLNEYDVSIEIPTEGLMLGETLSWYNAHI